MEYRIEKDFLGEVNIPMGSLYGIHSFRARENFPGSEPFPITWYKALGMVKLAYYESVEGFSEALEKEYPGKEWEFRIPSPSVLSALKNACKDVIEGHHFDHFIIPGIQGGAGTSINMNMNEILANLALQELGKEVGDYALLDPIEDANIFQSTNDTVPSALRIAAMIKLKDLEQSVNILRKEFEKKETEYRDILRIGYTQYQEAVPSSYGKLFSSYSDALSRDWWRISKGQERIKVLNLGGSAIGTGITVPRYVMMVLMDKLRSICNLPVSKAENLVDATANQDDLVELHGLLKTLAVNLEKISADLRLLSSDISVSQGITLPARQSGSSIMPGKVNPVIPEFVISGSHQVYANDNLITTLAAQGSLELNPYLPQIGINLLKSLDILTNACLSLANNCVKGITVDKEMNNNSILKAPSISTALVPSIGYKKAGKMAIYMKDNQCSIIEANKTLRLLNPDDLDKILKPENLLKQGFSVKDL